jgi:hypothetical protein
VPDFGRVFLMVKYTDITQNTCHPQVSLMLSTCINMYLTCSEANCSIFLIFMEVYTYFLMNLLNYCILLPRIENMNSQ